MDLRADNGFCRTAKQVNYSHPGMILRWSPSVTKKIL